MKAKRALQDAPMLGKNHSQDTRQKLREANKRQFENPEQTELRRKKSLEQMKDLERRKQAGNGSRGKSWYHNPNTNHCSKFIPGQQPEDYIKGRLIKKGGGDYA